MKLTTSIVAERIPLVPLRGPIEIVVDPLGARIVLRTAKPQPALAAQVTRHAGEICSKVLAIGTTIELRCRTRRFEAILSTEGSKKFLDIQELRGLPWRGGPDGPPFYHYDPIRTGIGTACPGGNAIARGECALQAGRQLQAATFFRAAMELHDNQLAALRLGDLSLSTGDPATAMGWYRRAGVAGAFGRMARTRVCEIEGTCLASSDIVKRVYDSRALPEPVRAEMSIRGVRAEAFAGRTESATRMMWQLIRNGSLAWVCREGGEIVCRRLLLQSMRDAAVAEVTPEVNAAAEAHPTAATPAPVQVARELTPPDGGAPVDARIPGAPVDVRIPGAQAGAPARAAVLASASRNGAGGAEPAHRAGVSASGTTTPASSGELSVAEMAFEIYLALPAWDHGELAPELSEAAADLAERVGAPVFGGNILAAVVPVVGPVQLPTHLYRAAELYFEGDDLARARLVIEYGRARLGGKLPARWVSLEKRIAARATSDDEIAAEPAKTSIDPEAIARELAAARAASTRARVARAETAPKKQGDRP
ncbi:MAG TPA: hypothetical protein VFH68_16040 [Polyangia bacterium]|nr:hypothetical protein [Polyangia bacterium]